MPKLIQKLDKIKVTANIEGTPMSIAREGRLERIIMIYQRWQTPKQLPLGDMPVHYFRVKTGKGHIYDICHDIGSGVWHLAKELV